VTETVYFLTGKNISQNIENRGFSEFSQLHICSSDWLGNKGSPAIWRTLENPHGAQRAVAGVGTFKSGVGTDKAASSCTCYHVLQSDKSAPAFYNVIMPSTPTPPHFTCFSNP